MSILGELRERFREALMALAGQQDLPALGGAGADSAPPPKVLPDSRPLLPSALADLEALLQMVQPAQDPKFGDYQANLAMPLGKQWKRPPRQVAAELTARLRVGDCCHAPEIAGPGFINLRVREDWLAQRLAQAVPDPRLGVPLVAQPKTYVIDYSAPNVAKPMHVGHIRSTVIGDSLYRMLKFLGHRVISDNHLGDWGTQFGMILYGYRHFVDRAAYEADPVHELARLYRLVQKLIDYQQNHSADPPHDPALAQLAAEHPQIATAVLAETAKLHAGDEEARRLWREFLPYCKDEIQRIYARLGVRFDYTLGESFYHDRLGPLVEDLLKRGIARESEGAVCIFFPDIDTPMIIRKQDGAFLYATTDLATLCYRMETWKPDAILYVVDFRQSLHFRQLFAVARRLGFDRVKLTHVSFGTVLGEDGRPFRTREGDTVGLESLLNEAVRRAAEIVNANDDAKPGGPELLPEERRRIAEVVGIGAIKYADLSQNRTSDYVFSYDKMLAMTGNTGTYMQYAYARIQNIFAKGGVNVETVQQLGGRIILKHPAERALGREIVRFPEAIDLVVEDYRPNQLTAYLFGLANRFSTFYENCPVLQAENAEERQSRLLLCDLTARVIRQGLELLGIEVVNKM